jgi:arsenical pump membrane protein
VLLALTLLGVGVAGAITRPRGLPPWVVPALAAAMGLVLGSPAHPGSVMRPLAAPIAFLLVAVPLATLLDRLGFFVAAAATLGRGRHLALGLWVFGAVVTTVLNLDAAIVLLTPLYFQIARRCGMDTFALAVQPVLLSCLASSALPVSNLTNLIVASARHVTATDFLVHLGPSSLAATVVGWFAYRWVVHPGVPAVPETRTPDRRALVIGGCVVAGVLVGFVAGPRAGVPEWAVALAADVVLMAITRRVPLRDVPVGIALVAGSLGLLAGGAAAHLSFDGLLAGSGNLDLLRIAVTSALGANAVNNLPALLVALPRTGPGIWALLLGVNVGPLILVTGTLAALLWQAGLGRLGIRVTAARFARVGVPVMLPVLASAVAVLLLLRPIVGG